MTDTTDEAVERLAADYSGCGLRDDDLVAATLRALLAERAALRQERAALTEDVRGYIRVIERNDAQFGVVQAERDAARAVALEEAAAVAEEREDNCAVWPDGYDIASAIRALAQKEPKT